MSYVPGYQHDVFVSYAPRDDYPALGCPHGWVTTLVTEIRRLLTEKLVESDLWMDHNLAGNDPITPTIYNHLEGSATLVIVLSTAYLASNWCRGERDAFLTRIDSFRQQGASIFVIEKEKIQEEDWPAELWKLKGYPFWQTDPLDKERMRTLGYPCPNPTAPEDYNYYKMIRDLSDDLIKELKQIKTALDTSPLKRISTNYGIKRMPESDSQLTFLGYSRKDSEFALKLAQDLRSAGLNIWMDQLNIQAGMRWDSSVEKALEDCECLLILLSPAAVKSSNVMDELAYALDEKKRVVPVLYRACKMPFRLRRIHYLDFMEDYETALNELIKNF